VLLQEALETAEWWNHLLLIIIYKNGRAEGRQQNWFEARDLRM